MALVPNFEAFNDGQSESNTPSKLVLMAQIQHLQELIAGYENQAGLVADNPNAAKQMASLLQTTRMELLSAQTQLQKYNEN